MAVVQVGLLDLLDDDVSSLVLLSAALSATVQRDLLQMWEHLSALAVIEVLVVDLLKRQVGQSSP